MSKEKKSTISLHAIYKLSTDRIVESKSRLKISYDEAIDFGEIVLLQDNQLFAAIRRYQNRLDMLDYVVNVEVPPPSGTGKSKKSERDYEKIASSGFFLNGHKFVRFCAGSGQIRGNTITFIRDDLYEPMFEALCCGLAAQHFGDDFSAAKFNAYFGLNMSGVAFLSKPPRVCVVDDYEEIAPHLPVDYILCRENDESITRWDGSTRQKKIIRKEIIPKYYDEIANADAINSFDGQGLATPEFMENLGYGYTPSEVIVRAPWVKGSLVAFDFKAFFREHDVTTITDIFGMEHKIDDIDVLLSKSQFKMWKVYANKGGWQYYTESMAKYGLQWGIVKPNKRYDDEYRPINYQFINALNLTDADISALMEQTMQKLERICSADINAVISCIGNKANTASYRSLIQKAVNHNPELLADKHIQTLIFNEAKAQFTAAKRGELEVHGNYQNMVSDPVAQAEWIIKRHGGKDISVRGLIPQGSVYANFWRGNNEIVLMRNPMIDRSEVLVRKVADSEDMRRWYGHITSGIIYSIHGLDPLTQQGADFDGDLTFSSNNPTLIKCAYRGLRPVVYDLPTMSIAGTVSPKNLIAADVRGLNSKVGQLSNKAAAFYAKLPNFTEDSPEHTEILKRIKILSTVVGEEIDSIKTGEKPKIPTSWSRIKNPYHEDENGKRDYFLPLEEQEKIRKHNELTVGDNDEPYYFRAVYAAKDRGLTEYAAGYNRSVMLVTGKNLQQLKSADEDTLNGIEKNELATYKKLYPLADTPCAMNKICHAVEQIEKSLRSQISKREMLREFGKAVEVPQDISDAIIKAAKRYGKHMKPMRNSDTNKKVAKTAAKNRQVLLQHFRNGLLGMSENNPQMLFNYMVALSRRGKIAESFIWNIMGDDLFTIIPKREGENGNI